MRRHLAAVTLAVLLCAGACGDDDPALDRRAARTLSQQIDLVEFAIAGGEYDAARRGLAEVREQTILLTEDQAISARRAPAIIDAIEDLERTLVEADAGA